MTRDQKIANLDKKTARIFRNVSRVAPEQIKSETGTLSALLTDPDDEANVQTDSAQALVNLAEEFPDDAGRVLHELPDSFPDENTHIKDLLADASDLVDAPEDVAADLPNQPRASEPTVLPTERRWEEPLFELKERRHPSDLPDERSHCEEQINTIHRYVDWYNETDFKAVEETLTDDIVARGLPGADEVVQGREEYKEWGEQILNVFPEGEIDLEHTIATDDFVTAVWTLSATHEGELFGISPTGQSVEVTGLALFRMDEGKIVEKWYQQDDTSMLQQLGIPRR